MRLCAGEKLKLQLFPDPSGNPGAIPHTFTVDLHGTLGSLKPMQLPVEVVPAAQGGCSYPYLVIKSQPLGDIRVGADPCLACSQAATLANTSCCSQRSVGWRCVQC